MKGKGIIGLVPNDHFLPVAARFYGDFQPMTRLNLSSRAGRWFLAGLVLALTLWLRLIQLESLPVFIDEATHLHWARQLVAGTNAYPRWFDGRVGLMLWFALFQLTGPHALWVVRAASAIAATLSAAACLSLGGRLSPRVGLLAGLIYALMPFAVFHDRQALADPLTSATGALILARLVRQDFGSRANLRFALSMGLALAATLLIKFTSVAYLVALVWSIGVWPWPKRWAVIRQHGASVAVMLIVIAAVLFSLRDHLGQTTSIFANAQISYVTCPPLLCAGDVAEQLRRLPAVLDACLALVPPYFGWPLVGLAAVAWLNQPARRLSVFLWLTILSMLVAVWLAAAQPLPPRYYSFLAAPMAVLAAVGIEAIAQRLHPRLSASVSVPVLLGLAVWPIANTWAIITQPMQAQLPAIDQRQYVSGPYAGGAFAQAAQLIQADATAPLVVADDWFTLPLGAYLDPTRVQIVDARALTWAEAEAALTQGQHIYIVEPLRYGLDNTDPNTLGVFPRGDDQAPVRVRALTQTNAAARHTLFGALWPRPDAFLASYDALLAQAVTYPIALAPYPSAQLPFLAERWALTQPANVQLLDLGGAQPWETASVIEHLAQADLTTQTLRVIFLDELRLDPNRAVETWLITHLFRMGEQFVGPLRVVDFAGAGAVQQTLTIDARFGEGIRLETVGIVDEAPRPGNVVRVRLVWRAESTTAETLKVFVHVIRADALIAQHDGQPVGELRPTYTWAAGEIITDQFALRLPADAAPGTYQLRIGLYEADTLTRWPTRLADGTLAEFYTGGEITIK
jgi:4-amino-4-deoxy-L-arabinose transferase-like glycosyltransferase